jgi:hypothetical protein
MANRSPIAELIEWPHNPATPEIESPVRQGIGRLRRRPESSRHRVDDRWTIRQMGEDEMFVMMSEAKR